MIQDFLKVHKDEVEASSPVNGLFKDIAQCINVVNARYERAKPSLFLIDEGVKHIKNFIIDNFC